jgi:hypothetical protein
MAVVGVAAGRRDRPVRLPARDVRHDAGVQGQVSPHTAMVDKLARRLLPFRDVTVAERPI